jgi:lipopolysaccharide/colanic/teichoic acid biosynthesis glycosyltransferase
MELVQERTVSKEIEQADCNNCRFYYIGKNPDNIAKLVKLLEYGFITDNIKNAKSELKHCLQKSKSFPEIIFCESDFGFSTIKKFCLFLYNHQSLSSIPVVVDAAGLNELELDLYRRNKLADEITLLQDTDENNIILKMQFLKKLKMLDLQDESGFKKGLQSVDTVLQSVNFRFTLKRSFDIVISLIALCLLSPLFLLIALAISIESKGPAFYISKRAGRGYRIFNLYKFRTMFVGADKRINEFFHLNQYNTNFSNGPSFFKIDNDPRITKVGSFLRKTSLDELPQLINVLLGDMSLVGNRPLPLYEAATLTTDECAKRFLAPAGMTGLWQVKKRGKKDMSVEERINLDIHYANKNSFMYDVWIMANTPSALFQKSNS